jgi:cell shape-determining protein MreC
MEALKEKIQELLEISSNYQLLQAENESLNAEIFELKVMLGLEQPEEVMPDEVPEPVEEEAPIE